MKLRLIFTASLASLAVFLSGCGAGSNPGSESVQQDVFPAAAFAIDQSGYYDVSVDMGVSIADDEFDVGAQCSASIEGSGDVVHVKDMSVSMTGGGSDFSSSVESWYDGSAAFSRKKDSDTWMMAELDSDGVMDDMFDFSSYFPCRDGNRSFSGKGESSLFSWESEKGSVSKFMDVFFPGISDAVASSDMGVITVTAEFDKDSRLMSITAESKEAGADGSIAIRVTVNSVSADKALSVPDEILNADYEPVQPSSRKPLPEWGSSVAEADRAEVYRDESVPEEKRDADIEGILESIIEANPGYQILEVKYEDASYGADSVLEYTSGSGTDWHGSLSVRKFSDGEKASSYFSSMLEEDLPFFGDPVESRSENGHPVWSVQVSDGNADGSVYVTIIGRNGNMVMWYGMYDWSAKSKEEAVEDAMKMIGATGIEWGRGAE